MARLNVECIRALLERSLQISQSTKKKPEVFLKFMVISKIFTACARYPKYDIYCFVFFVNGALCLQFSSTSNMSKCIRYGYALPSSFSRDLKQNRLMILLLNPPIVKLRFNTINFIEECSVLLEEPFNSKIAIKIIKDPTPFLPFLNKFASRIFKLKFDGCWIPDGFTLSPMKMGFLKIDHLKSTDQLKNILERQTMKKLKISIDGDTNDFSFQEDTFICESVSDLQLDITFDSENNSVKRVINLINRIFPNVKFFDLKININDGSFYDQPFNSKDLINIALKNYDDLQKIKDDCRYEKTKIDFSLVFYAQKQDYYRNWIQQMKNHERFKGFQSTLGVETEVNEGFVEFSEIDEIKYKIEVVLLDDD